MDPDAGDRSLSRTRHADHFLTRLDRLASAEVELALRLYREPTLLRAILGAVALPESAERVAIALSEAAVGPYLVVTRTVQLWERSQVQEVLWLALRSATLTPLTSANSPRAVSKMPSATSRAKRRFFCRHFALGCASGRSPERGAGARVAARERRALHDDGRVPARGGRLEVTRS
jgi:hypothetical protein